MKKVKNIIPSCLDCQNKNKVFCAMSTEEKAEVSREKGHNFYKKGQTIFYEGNHSNGLYCIHSGKVSLTKLGDDGKRQVVRFAKEGEILGYRSLISGDSYQATATAIEDCTICFVQKEKFNELIATNAGVAVNSMQLLASDLRNAENKLISIAQKSVKERIIESILLLQETFGFENDGETLDVTLSRAEIADTAGTTTETTIRTLAKLSDENLINLVGKKIKILNLGELKKACSVLD
ncbi:MAG: Crp/Fnr family transcriptional regulator [Crocinitomicaceae bacterium]|nr:Crp/Fnr family transcriptional regulator [Crocinitomicaceae bacterium]